jgi:hypothetical protein
MKKNKIAMIGLTFFLGVAFGVSLFAILAFKGSDTPQPGPSAPPISCSEARTLFYNYFNTAQTITARPKGYTIDRTMLTSLNSLATAYPNLQRFRIYIGKDARGVTQGIVLCVDAAGLDYCGGNIYQTNSPETGPCPFLCDDNSQIISPN